MSVQITIQGTVIDFPSSGQSPNWAPAVIEFAQAVEQALSGVVGEYDVSPQVIEIENGVVDKNILALSFSTAIVRSAEITYSVYRKNAVPFVEAETGKLTVVYNGTTWEIERECLSNQATPTLTFKILSTGQVQYTASAISAAGYEGKLSFYAKSLLQTNT